MLAELDRTPYGGYLPRWRVELSAYQRHTQAQADTNHAFVEQRLAAWVEAREALRNQGQDTAPLTAQIHAAFRQLARARATCQRVVIQDEAIDRIVTTLADRIRAAQAARLLKNESRWGASPEERLRAWKSLDDRTSVLDPAREHALAGFDDDG
jgi:hypothetical protein